MDKIELRKNILEMEYKQKLQEYTIIISFMTIGILGFLASFIWFFERLYQGFALATLFLFACITLAKKIQNRLQELREDVDKLMLS